MVVIAIGDDYTTRYRRLYWPSHVSYCRKHGYDLLVVDHFIAAAENDRSLMSLQKALVCSLPEAEAYSHVAHVDADVLINTALAPPLLEAVGDTEAVAIVDEASQPTPELRAKIRKRKKWESSSSEYYRSSGFDIETPHLLNTGMFVAQPRLHRTFLESVYAEGQLRGRNHPRGFHYEQALIGYHLQKNGMFTLLDNRWNAIFGMYLFARQFGFIGSISRRLLRLPTFRSSAFAKIFAETYFLHMAGGGHIGIEGAIERLVGRQGGVN